MTSAFLNRRSENILVHPVVIAELELGDIERHVFFADLMEASDDTALENRPEAFDGLGMNRADDVLAGCVVDNGMRELLAYAAVPSELIGAKQADFGRDGLIDESGECGTSDVLNDAGDDIALAADCAGDWRLASSARAASLATLVDMPVLGEAADESFVNFDNPGQLLELFIGECRTDAMHHVPSGFIAAEAHDAVHLAGADAFFARQHVVDDAKPVTKRLIGVLENRAGEVRKAVATLRGALVALPMPRLVIKLMGVCGATARAMNAFGPTLAGEIGAASLFIGEHRFKLSDGHLNDLFRLFLPRHDANPSLLKGI